MVDAACMKWVCGVTINIKQISWNRINVVEVEFIWAIGQ